MQNKSTITVNGSGFSTLTVINFFNAQSGGVANLGGLNPKTVWPKIPLTIVNEDKFTFTVPAGAVAGSDIRAGAQSAVRAVQQYGQRSGWRVDAVGDFDRAGVLAEPVDGWPAGDVDCDGHAGDAGRVGSSDRHGDL